MIITVCAFPGRAKYFYKTLNEQNCYCESTNCRPTFELEFQMISNIFFPVSYNYSHMGGTLEHCWVPDTPNRPYISCWFKVDLKVDLKLMSKHNQILSTHLLKNLIKKLIWHQINVIIDFNVVVGLNLYSIWVELL